MLDTYSYIIVGAGLAGASAIEGIREGDDEGSVLLVGSEPHLPYDRPPLTKDLWFGKKQPAEITLHDRDFYRQQRVECLLGTSIAAIDRKRKRIRDTQGRELGYGTLLLATGGTPRRLTIPGGDLPGIVYYRTYDDYVALRSEAQPGRSAVVIGGGFIGSELAGALSQARVLVTMLFPEPYPAARIVPEGLGRAIAERYRGAGIELVHERPAAIERRDGRFLTRTGSGRELASEMLVVGIGIAPSTELARSAELETGDGIVVDEQLRTSDPSIYAAGDVALFPYQVLARTMRVEHWDNARAQGRQAGRNMAGAAAPYRYMPFFFSDLFELGYEAVGEVDSRLSTVAEWQHENETGVIRYLRDGRVRGVMMCNVWDKVEEARALIAAEAETRPRRHDGDQSSPEREMAQKVTPEQARELARGFPDWTCDGQTLEREFSFKDFRESMAFVSRVADAAERADHHPDIHVSYDHVKLALTTHTAGGLTDRDFKLARTIDSVV